MQTHDGVVVCGQSDERGVPSEFVSSKHDIRSITDVPAAPTESAVVQDKAEIEQMRTEFPDERDRTARGRDWCTMLPVRSLRYQ